MPAATLISSRTDPEGKAEIEWGTGEQHAIHAGEFVTAGLCASDDGHIYAEVTAKKNGQIIVKVSVYGEIVHAWELPKER